MQKLFFYIKVSGTTGFLMAVVYFIGHIFLQTNKAEEIIAIYDPELHEALDVKKEDTFDIATFVADAIKGQKVAKKCKACHTFKKGGAHRVGPNLWRIFNRDIASESFKYSTAFISQKGKISWDDKHLNAYIENPKGYIPGNKMVFKGIKNEADRLNLIAWLKTLED